MGTKIKLKKEHNKNDFKKKIIIIIARLPLLQKAIEDNQMLFFGGAPYRVLYTFLNNPAHNHNYNQIACLTCFSLYFFFSVSQISTRVCDSPERFLWGRAPPPRSLLL